MAGSGLILKSFYTQLVTIGSIALSSVLGFNYLVSENKKQITEQLAPLVKKVNKLETLLAVNAKRTDANWLSANVFIGSYNRTFSKEFLRPADISEKTIKEVDEDEE